jgi:hypothetical protein
MEGIVRPSLGAVRRPVRGDRGVSGVTIVVFEGGFPNAGATDGRLHKGHDDQKMQKPHGHGTNLWPGRPRVNRNAVICSYGT